MEHIHPFQVIGVILLAVAFWYVRKQKLAAKGPAKGAPGTGPHGAIQRPVKPVDPPEVVYANLRKRAFATSPQSLGSAGDVGLYYRSGGGMKGGGAHENVRKAAKEFVNLVQKALPQMTQAKDTPLPEAGKVHFYALTPKGLLTSEVDRESLGEAQSPFAPLFYSGQEVVAQMRQVQAQKAS